jgi:hypothetical protein
VSPRGAILISPSGRGAYDFDHELAPKPGGTRLASNVNIDLGEGLVARILLKVRSGIIRSQCEKDLDAMQRHFEGDPSTVSPATPSS